MSAIDTMLRDLNAQGYKYTNFDLRETGDGEPISKKAIAGLKNLGYQQSGWDDEMFWLFKPNVPESFCVFKPYPSETELLVIIVSPT